VATHQEAFTGPGCYRIVVQGQLNQAHSQWFGNMTASPSADNSSTVLEGSVADQAELVGILTALYELHLPLLAVRKLEDQV